MSEERWTIRRLLEWTENYFRGKGIEKPRLETQILLARALGCSRIDLYTRSDEEPTPDQRGEFRSFVKQRTEGMPVAYLVGTREFYSLSFEVTPAVLIPRPETEELVAACLHVIKAMEKPRVLDIGTGSGNIAVTIAHEHETAEITAVDISPEALALARRNADRHRVSARMRFLEGDLFAPLQPDQRFDVIISNPPYVSETELESLAPEVKDREPRLALAAGPDGLDVYRRLIPESVRHLEPGGSLLLEIGATQEKAVVGLIEQTPGLHYAKTIRDAARLPRVVRAVCVD